ncbi:uncharacterized protein AAG666_009909 isoform 1-T1 [Megaptera novaeangliae]
MLAILLFGWLLLKLFISLLLRTLLAFALTCLKLRAPSSEETTNYVYRQAIGHRSCPCWCTLRGIQTGEKQDTGPSQQFWQPAKGSRADFSPSPELYKELELWYQQKPPLFLSAPPRKVQMSLDAFIK